MKENVKKGNKNIICDYLVWYIQVLNWCICSNSGLSPVSLCLLAVMSSLQDTEE